MRFSLAAVIISCGLLASCAYQGVIVDKSAREMPFGLSSGTNGSFAFMLKDTAGTVHRQLVTPDVFARYEVGDYFNDLQAGPARQQRASDGKTMLSAATSNESSRTRTVANQKRSSAHRFAKKTAKRPHSIASAAKRSRAKKIVPTIKPEQAHTVAAAAWPQPAPAEVAYVGVARVSRCR
jgi:hypothetical protein